MLMDEFSPEEPTGRRMPASVASEAALLGGLMLDPEAWAALPELDAMAFYAPMHREVFCAVRALATAGAPTDPVSVFEELRRQAADTTLPQLTELAQFLPGRASMRRYADEILDQHRLRQLMQAGTAMVDAAMEPGAQAAAEIDKAQMLLAKMASSRSKRDPQRIDASLSDYMAMLLDLSEGRNPAMATGIGGLDRILNGGLRRGELLVLGARPKHGKTALALAIARALAKHQSVLFLSQEMPISQLMHRHSAAAAAFDLGRILAADPNDAEMWSAVTAAVKTLEPLRLFHDDQTSLTLGDIRRKALKVKREAGLDVIFVDFLQRMASSEKDNRSRDLDLIVNGIKDLAMDLDMAAVVLSQMNRKADETYGRPNMSHLRESGAIEAAADQIALMFTDWAHPQSKRLPELQGYSELEIVAHRNGPQGLVPLRFLGSYQLISDWDDVIPKIPIPIPKRAPSKHWNE
ncbi:replicative DNA helicase [Delftia tsuruhatensis]